MKRFFVSMFLASVLGSVSFVAGCGEVVADQIGDSTATAPDDKKPPTDQPPTKYCAPDDVDCDGFGKHKPDGGVLDCNDGNAAAHPSIPGYVAEEICNGLDDDCNGETDEGFSYVKVYRDADGDEYGDSALPLELCQGSFLPAGYVAQGGDCHDADKEIHPDAADTTLDGKDQNCNDVDGQPTTPEQTEETEPAPAAKPGSLKAETAKATRMELSYELFATYADMGKSWSAPAAVEPWADETNDFSVTAQIPDTQYACGLRVGLQFGGGSGAKYVCVDGEISELLAALELKIGETTLTLDDAQVWLDPNGGCGLYFTWGDACAAPNK